MRKTVATLAVVVMLAAVAVAGSAVASGGGDVRSAKTRVVKVGDDFFSKRSLTVNRNDIVEWRWTPDAGYTETNEHNVTGFYGYGRKKGETAFASKDLTSGKYRKKLRTRGSSFRVVCTIHPVRMTMKVAVRK